MRQGRLYNEKWLPKNEYNLVARNFGDIDTLIEYLERNWPESVLKDFQQNLFDKIDLLERGFLQGRSTNKDAAICSVLITKHNRLYYEFEGDNLLLLRLWDTRQNPTKHPFE